MSLPAPTVTGWSTFWSNIAPTGQGAAYSTFGNRYSPEWRASFELGKPGMKAIRRLMRVLMGTVAGSTATENETRVIAPIGLAGSPPGRDLGGLRSMETFVWVNRVTTAADNTYMLALLDRKYASAPAVPAGYPTDPSRNGGGGKLGF